MINWLKKIFKKYDDTCMCDHNPEDHHPLAKRCLIYMCDCDHYIKKSEFMEDKNESKGKR